MKIFPLALSLTVALAMHAHAADAARATQLLKQAQTAFEGKRVDEALTLITEAVAADPWNPEIHYVRGRLNDAKHQFAAAAADYSQVLKLTPSAVGVYYRRGEALFNQNKYEEAIADYNAFLKVVKGADRAEALEHRGEAHFKLGHIEESIQDFDGFIALVPQQEPQHWQRGIAYYYAGEFTKGRKQFELHQTVNPNDVENAVWHFLCVARESNVEKARAALIKIRGDSRVPMMEIYALFAGTGTVEGVLQAVRAGSPGPGELNYRMFYAHLYLGLYYEATGEPKAAREHITKAARDYKHEGNYMWDVARVHAALLEKQSKPK